MWRTLKTQQLFYSGNACGSQGNRWCQLACAEVICKPFVRRWYTSAEHRNKFRLGREAGSRKDNTGDCKNSPSQVFLWRQANTSANTYLADQREPIPCLMMELRPEVTCTHRLCLLGERQLSSFLDRTEAFHWPRFLLWVSNCGPVSKLSHPMLPHLL